MVNLMVFSRLINSKVYKELRKAQQSCYASGN